MHREEAITTLIGVLFFIIVVSIIVAPSEVQRCDVKAHVTYYNGDEAVFTYNDVHERRWKLDEGDLKRGSHVVASGVRSYWIERDNCKVVKE